MKQNNETWLIHLKSKGADQQEALTDLRDALLRGLRGTLWNGSHIDDAPQNPKTPFVCNYLYFLINMIIFSEVQILSSILFLISVD